MIRMRPKIRVKPLASRKRSAASVSPLTNWSPSTCADTRLHASNLGYLSAAREGRRAGRTAGRFDPRLGTQRARPKGTGAKSDRFAVRLLDEARRLRYRCLAEVTIW